MENIFWLLYTFTLILIIFKVLDLPLDRWVDNWERRNKLIKTYGKEEANKYREWHRTHTSGVYTFPARRIESKE